MAKISLKKDYMDGNVLYGKDLNPNFETIETTINANDGAQSETNASVNEAITQLSSDMSQAKTDIGKLQENVTNLESGITSGDSTTLESAKSYTDTKLQDYAKTTDVPTKISQLENNDNTVKDADYVHTDNNFSDTDKSKLDSLNNYELPIASADTLGGIKVGDGLGISSFGDLMLNSASATQLGGVKAGDGVEIESDGTLNVTGGSTGNGIPTLVGTQENPIKLYSINSGTISDGVPIGLCIISGYAKELITSEVTDKFNGKLCYTASDATQFIGPYYNGNDSASDTFLNLVFWFRPGTIQVGTSYFSQPLIEFTYNDIITNTKQGYVTPKAVYDYVGALASLNTEDKSSIVNAINELVNSTGGDGLDYLGFKGNIGLGQTPVTGQTFTNDFVYFTRTPVVGDTFIALGQQVSGPTYLLNCEVTEVTDTAATYKLTSFTNTQGEEGPRGVQGNPGPQGDPGPAGADGVTPTIGENGNWYLGETDTGKPSRGEKGEQGSQGLPGPTGPGVPVGGTIGQVLSKIGDGDYETGWKDIESGSSTGFKVLNPTAEEPIDLAAIQENGFYYCKCSSNEQFDAYLNKFSTDYNGDFITLILGDSVSYKLRLEITALTYVTCRIYVGYNAPDNQKHYGSMISDIRPSENMNLRNNISFASVTSIKKLADAIGRSSENVQKLVPLSDLQTTDKSSLVAAINELNTRLAALENPTE